MLSVTVTVTRAAALAVDGQARAAPAVLRVVLLDSGLPRQWPTWTSSRSSNSVKFGSPAAAVTAPSTIVTQWLPPPLTRRAGSGTTARPPPVRARIPVPVCRLGSNHDPPAAPGGTPKATAGPCLAFIVPLTDLTVGPERDRRPSPCIPYTRPNQSHYTRHPSHQFFFILIFYSLNYFT
jgi:hypothetical protein